jgi:hypothetical protein
MNFVKDGAVNPKYNVGQRVVIRPAGGDAGVSLRDGDISLYAGQIGEVSDYYWISPRTGRVFYMYTVRLGAENKELVLHEDEIEDILE